MAHSDPWHRRLLVLVTKSRGTAYIQLVKQDLLCTTTWLQMTYNLAIGTALCAIQVWLALGQRELKGHSNSATQVATEDALNTKKCTDQYFSNRKEQPEDIFNSKCPWDTYTAYPNFHCIKVINRYGNMNGVMIEMRISQMFSSLHHSPLTWNVSQWKCTSCWKVSYTIAISTLSFLAIHLLKFPCSVA